MDSDSEPLPLTRWLKASEIKDGESGEIVANAAEIEAIARLLELVRLGGLSLHYRFRHGGGGRLQLSGRLRADLTQTCVVTLEPLDTTIDVPVEIEFWPEGLLKPPLTDEEPASVAALEELEPIVAGRIDLGRVAYETLATSLDPYPKREGASFDWSQPEPGEAQDAKTGPFAALAGLKRP